MDWNFTFVFNSVLLGVGLAMDAFSVAMAKCPLPKCAALPVFSLFFRVSCP